MRDRGWLGMLVLTAWMVGCTEPPPPPPPPTEGVVDGVMRHAAELITADDIERVVRELSDDRFEGRAPGTVGDELTQRYLIDAMASLSLAPAGGGAPAADGGAPAADGGAPAADGGAPAADGGAPAAGGGAPAADNPEWLQPFELVGLETAQPPNWDFVSMGGEVITFLQGSEYILSSGIQAETAGLEDAELVFVGYGIQAPEYDWDDFKGQDVSGKVLVVLNNDPDWADDLFAGETRLYYGRWSYKYEIAARLGAAGVIIVHTDDSAGYPWQVVQTSWNGPQFELPHDGEPTVALKAWMTQAAVARLFASRGHDLAGLEQAARNRTFAPIPLGLKTTLSVDVEMTSAQTANVLGLLPGTDP